MIFFFVIVANAFDLFLFLFLSKHASWPGFTRRTTKIKCSYCFAYCFVQHWKWNSLNRTKWKQMFWKTKRRSLKSKTKSADITESLCLYDAYTTCNVLCSGYFFFHAFSLSPAILMFFHFPLSIVHSFRSLSQFYEMKITLSRLCFPDRFVSVFVVMANFFLLIMRKSWHVLRNFKSWRWRAELEILINSKNKNIVHFTCFTKMAHILQYKIGIFMYWNDKLLFWKQQSGV